MKFYEYPASALLSTLILFTLGILFFLKFISDNNIPNIHIIPIILQIIVPIYFINHSLTLILNENTRQNRISLIRKV